MRLLDSPNSHNYWIVLLIILIFVNLIEMISYCFNFPSHNCQNLIVLLFHYFFYVLLIHNIPLSFLFNYQISFWFGEVFNIIHISLSLVFSFTDSVLFIILKLGCSCFLIVCWDSLVSQMVRICLQFVRPGFDPWVGKIPWRSTCQPTPVFFPGESTWTEDLVGYSPQGLKESDMTEQISTLC